MRSGGGRPPAAAPPARLRLGPERSWLAEGAVSSPLSQLTRKYRIAPSRYKVPLPRGSYESSPQPLASDRRVYDPGGGVGRLQQQDQPRSCRTNSAPRSEPGGQPGQCQPG